MEACWDKSLVKILLSMCRVVGNNASAMRAISMLVTAMAEDLLYVGGSAKDSIGY